jgi:hypothetical protein
MRSNINTADKLIRLLSALAIGIMIAFDVIIGTTALVLGIAGAVLALTAFINFCPIYAMLGFSTKSRKQ